MKNNSENKEKIRILIVCLGNICRSPLAEGILRHKIDKYNLNWHVESAGTSSWHADEPPDIRSQDIAMKHGIDISHQKGRPFRGIDFEEFDLIYVMDRNNYKDVMKHAQSHHEKNKVKMILDELHPGENKHVPDPYLDNDGFHHVYEMLDKACDAIIRKYS